MLINLQIINYAIVAQLNLEFHPKMTVLTGETGAGKSILVDALGLATGERADTNDIRYGAERAEVSAVFQITQLRNVQDYLKEHELDNEDDSENKECLLRRIVGKDGRSRAFINGRSVPLQSLRELSSLLIDIHGQHAHQSLLFNDTQRQILDDYAENAVLLTTVAEYYRQLHQLTTEYQRLQQAAADRDNRLDYLRFQLQELEQLALQAGELEILEEEHRWLANSTRLLEGGQAALARLQGDSGAPSVLALLARARNELRHLQVVDTRLTPAAELLEGAVIQVEEAATGLRHYLAILDLDPQRLDFVEERLATIAQLSRKHRVQPSELPELTKRLQAEVAMLENSEIRAEELATALTTARQVYHAAALQLHEARARVGKELSQQVTENLHILGIPDGQFNVSCEFIAQQTAIHGADRVEFLVSTNPGAQFRTLNKVVSGGELSRISLALQVLVATNLRVPTLIFDEVDVGIGGRVAAIVGKLLRRLGEQRQVLCVTHLPQVASAGHQHCLVVKRTDGFTTNTSIQNLVPTERIQEIARMLGGVEVTESTLLHAEEMLNLANSN